MVFALIAFCFFILSCTGRVINRFSAELLWLCAAAAATALSGSWAVAAAYVVSLYLWAGPSPRLRFPFAPLEIDEIEFDSWFNEIGRFAVPGDTIGFVFDARDMDAFRVECKYWFLFCAWISRSHYRAVCLARPEIGMGDFQTDAPFDAADRYGIEWLVTPCRGRMEDSFTIGPVGSVPLAHYALFPGCRNIKE